MSFAGFLNSNPGGGSGGCGGGNGGVVSETPYLTNNANMAPGAVSERFVPPSFNKSIFNAPGPSLALQTGMEGSQAELTGEQENENRFGSDTMEGSASGDDQQVADNPPRKKRYHRHTRQQIQELEAVFKECPHPDEKQRLQLSKRLRLHSRQVKYWFQNRRTHMKTQSERHENSMLRKQNDNLRAENLSIRDAIGSPMCTNCGGPAMMGDSSVEEQQLRIENARLKDELDHVRALVNKFLGQQLPSSALELGVRSNGFDALSTVTSLPLAPTFEGSGTSNVTGIERSMERSMYLQLALAAMDELVKMARTEEPIWLRSSMEGGGREILNEEEYMRAFTSCIGPKPNGYVTEASKEMGMVIINSLALVETLMDSNRWADMFPCMVARTSTTDVIANGMGGTRNGELKLMHAELQVLSPLVPVRVVNFLRFCKQQAEGVWAIVDVSIDYVGETSGAPTFVNCRRLPSGCVVQDMPNGYSKVTWVEHAEYDESGMHQLYRPLIRAGMGFGAQRWVATLQRQCECVAILMSSIPAPHHTAITASGRRSLLKLARRMTDSFCTGLCASTAHKWNKLSIGSIDEDVQVMTRKSSGDPGEPSGVVLSAATSVRLPVCPRRLLDFLRDERLRSRWDVLSNGGGPMQEMARIVRAQDQANCVSLLRASATNASHSSMLILQETCTDASGSLVVYAPVDVPAMHLVMSGGDSAYVVLLPSGFAVVPDGPAPVSSRNAIGPQKAGGSLLTVGFQILVNSLPAATLTVESVETVSNLISCTIQRIKAALQRES